MNIEFVNVESANINSIFENYDELIQTFIDFLKENLNDFCMPNIEKNIINYRTIKLNDYPNDYITAQIYGVYQNGIVFKIVAHSDPGIYKYDTITSGLLIINENNHHKFIIDRIDGRYEINKSITGIKNPSIFIKTNNDKIEESIKELGERIDQNYIEKRKNNIFNNGNRHQQKINMLGSKTKLLVLMYIEKLTKKEKTKLTKKLSISN